MFASDRAAGFDAAHQDLSAGGHHPVQDTRLARVKQDHGVQVAVASVKQIRDGQVIALADLDHSHALAEETRGEAVRRAIGRMEAALEHAAAVVLPFPG